MFTSTRTNEPTNQQTRRIAIPPGAANKVGHTPTQSREIQLQQQCKTDTKLTNESLHKTQLRRGRDVSWVLSRVQKTR